MKPKLYIVTGNTMKFKELSGELQDFFDCEQREVDEPEIQGTPEEIIRHKALRAYEVCKGGVLVDDATLELSDLSGFPGPYVKDFFECFPPYELGIKFEGSKFKSSCWLGLCRAPGDVLIVEGSITGKIIKPKREDHQGRWFDLCTQVDGTDKPLIEFSHEEKNKFSHRGRAMKKLIVILQKEQK